MRRAFCICSLATKHSAVRGFRRIVVGIDDRFGLRRGADDNGFADIIIGIIASVVAPLIAQSACFVGCGSFGSQGRFVLHRSAATAPNRFVTLNFVALGFVGPASITLACITLACIMLTCITLARVALANFNLNVAALDIATVSMTTLDVAAVGMATLVSSILEAIVLFGVRIAITLLVAPLVTLVALLVHGALLTVTLLLGA